MNKLHCYTRVSTTEQKKKGTSLEEQIEVGKKVSKKLGLKFVLVNEGDKSSTTDYREELENLKYEISLGKVKNIWVLESSRLFRDSRDSMNFRVQCLDEYDVNLYQGNERNVNLVQVETSEEKLMYSMFSEFHQYMNEVNRERSVRGKTYKLKRDKDKGVFLGQTILFGYENVDKTWKVHKEDSKIVKMIFKMYDEGQSIKDIKNELDLLGIKTRRTKTGLWNLETLRKMLMNKSYIGLHKIVLKSKRERDVINRMKKNKRTKTEILESTKKFIKDRETINVVVPKIISVSQFNRVNRRLDFKSVKKFNSRKHETLLTELMSCECGLNISSKVKNYTNKKGFKEESKLYFCSSKNYSWKTGVKSRCENKRSLDMTKTDETIVSLVKDVVSNSSVLKEKFKSKVLGRKNKMKKEIEQERQIIEDKIRRIQIQIENIEEQIVELIVRDVSKKEKSLFEKINKRFEEELELKHKTIKQCEEQLHDLDTESSWIDWIEEHGKDLDIQTKDFKSQRDFLEKTIDSIVVKSVYGKDRNKKTVQIGHKFDINFKLKLVNDSIEYLDETNKSKGYNVIEGNNVLKTSNLDVGTTMGRKKKVD